MPALGGDDGKSKSKSQKRKRKRKQSKTAARDHAQAQFFDRRRARQDRASLLDAKNLVPQPRFAAPTSSRRQFVEHPLVDHQDVRQHRGDPRGHVGPQRRRLVMRNRRGRRARRGGEGLIDRKVGTICALRHHRRPHAWPWSGIATGSASEGHCRAVSRKSPTIAEVAASTRSSRGGRCGLFRGAAGPADREGFNFELLACI